MLSSLQRRQLAIQREELNKVQRTAMLEIRQVLSTLRGVVVERLRQNKPSILTHKELAKLTNTFARVFAASEQLGRRRTRIAAKVLQASYFDQFEVSPLNYSQGLQVVTGYAQDLNLELEAFTKGLIGRGLALPSMIQELQAKFAALGLDPAQPFRLEAIARTKSQIVYNAGKYQEEQQPYIQDILWGYTYSTLRDTRVRDEHAPFEGVTLPKDDPFWKTHYTPNGWNCRCSVIAVFEKQPIVRPTSMPVIDPAFARNPVELLGNL